MRAHMASDRRLGLVEPDSVDMAVGEIYVLLADLCRCAGCVELIEAGNDV